MEATLNMFSTSCVDNRHPFEAFDAEGQIYTDHLGGLKNEIDSFTKLDHNWDGYGAVPLLESIGNKAKYFISLLNDTYVDNIYDLQPNSNGTISIEWLRDNDKLFLEIGENNYSYFISCKDKQPKFFNGQNLPDLKDFISHLGEIYKNEIPQFIFR